MITFIIQAETESGQLLPVHDFAWTLLESIRYHKWFYREEKFRYVLHGGNWSFRPIAGAPEAEYYDYLRPDCIPIGSVEFVSRFIQETNPKAEIKPLNVPPELFEYSYTGRDMQLVDVANKKRLLLVGRDYDMLKYNPMVFAKSADKIKEFAEIVSPSDLPPSGTYLLSEVVDIDAEWRVFVYKGKLLDIRNYSGTIGVFPDMTQVEEMVGAYKNAPPAYTLDVAVLKNGMTVIIECHNFFSCGLYGFADHKNLPMMFIKAFQWQISERS